MKCPSCGQEFGHRYVQPALVAGRPDKVYVHCMDDTCPMYTQTTCETEEAVAKKWQEVQDDINRGAAMKYDIFLITEIVVDGECIETEWTAIRRHVTKATVTKFLKQNPAWRYQVQEVEFVKAWQEWRDTGEESMNGEYWLEVMA